MESYIPQLSVTMSLAIMQAYIDYEEWNKHTGIDCKFHYDINLPGYRFLDRIVNSQSFTECCVPLGFTATGGSGDLFPAPNNVLAFRGTQTTVEGIEDLDWSHTPCVLPSSGGKTYGRVASGLYNFYSVGGILCPSVESSVKSAVAKLNKSLPLVIAGHSLGGAMATLAALEIVANGWYPADKVRLYTYGSLHVGNKAFTEYFDENHFNIPVFRVANLADWVPSFLGGLSTGEDAANYVHVGLPCTFLWQTDGDWTNHSMKNMYLKVVRDFSRVIKFGERLYPQ